MWRGERMSNLDRLIRFSVVAEEMSFSKAARRLNVDQPWLSRQIQQLEAQMGFPLFVRSTRRVSLTDEGEALFASAHDRSEEHTSELQSLMRISYAVFCLKKQKPNTNTTE